MVVTDWYNRLAKFVQTSRITATNFARISVNCSVGNSGNRSILLTRNGPQSVKNFLGIIWRTFVVKKYPYGVQITNRWPGETFQIPHQIAIVSLRVWTLDKLGLLSATIIIRLQCTSRRLYQEFTSKLGNSANLPLDRAESYLSTHL